MGRDLGIRQGVNARFLELLPQKATLGNTEFRRSVNNWAMEQFGVTLASASTHYNHALISTRKMAEDEKQPQAFREELAKHLEGLGRAPDKKGGRKKKVAPEVVAPEAGAAVDPVAGAAEEVAADAGNDDKPVEEVAADAGNTDEPPVGGQGGEPETVQLYAVYKKKDDSIVAEGLSFDAAQAMVAENEGKQFKPKLYLK